MVTLFSCSRSIHSLKVLYLFFTKINGAPQGDTLGRIYPLRILQDAYATPSILVCPFYKDFWTLGQLLSPNQSLSLVAVLGYPQKHLKNPSRLDGSQYLEFYFWLPLPYGLQTCVIPS